MYRITPERKTVELWFCKGCSAVHLKAGGMQLSFQREEFAAFTEMVVDTYSRDWLPADGDGPIKLGDSVAVIDEVFLSSEVH